MTGARKLAMDYIRPLMTPGASVLDACCGDRWVHSAFPNQAYVGIDKPEFDLTKDGWWDHRLVGPDLILSIYGLQHLLSEEARVWTLLRRIAKPTTKFVYVGRLRHLNPGREMNRADPLNAHDRSSLSGLALASGWEVEDFRFFEYHEDSYSEYFTRNDYFPRDKMNAFCATLRTI